MLPFLAKKQIPQDSDAAVINSADRPDRKRDVSAALELAMKELFTAQDDRSRALAFKAAFELLEMQPHSEAPHNG
jgi:hypothetical protein